MTAPVNPVEAVRERLAGGRQWYKGDLYSPDGTKTCLLGAVSAELNHSVVLVQNTIERVAIEQYPDRIESTRDLRPAAAFNDHPDTTWADVDLVLDKAARRWDEQS